MRVLGRHLDVVTARDAQEAIATLAAQTFDAIVTDFNMPPGEDGLWLLAEVARVHPSMRRLLMSTPDPIPGLADALADGTVHRFFAKPIDFTELILVIAR
jgi:DNA-binding NtrC family response regulator